MVRVQVSRTPDGATYFCLARTVRPPGRASDRGGIGERGRLLAIGLGCEVQYGRDIVYADGLHLDDPQVVTPIGTSCRTCPRMDCPDRASPSLAQRMDINENQRGLSTQDAVNMIVNGYCKEVFKQLPMEFAVEAQKLLGVSLEGSVG